MNAAAAFALVRDTQAGKAFADLLTARLNCVTNPHVHPPTVTDPTVITHARWNAALRELYKAAAKTK